MRKTENAARGPMSDGEHAQSAHVLRDDELDVVSGGKRKGGAIIVFDYEGTAVRSEAQKVVWPGP